MAGRFFRVSLSEVSSDIAITKLLESDGQKSPRDLINLPYAGRSAFFESIIHIPKLTDRENLVVVSGVANLFFRQKKVSDGGESECS